MKVYVVEDESGCLGVFSTAIKAYCAMRDWIVGEMRIEKREKQGNLNILYVRSKDFDYQYTIDLTYVDDI